MKNRKFQEMLEKPLEDCVGPTRPMREGRLGGEYLHGIMDYETLDARYKPYNATDTHGPYCYQTLAQIVTELGIERLIDLGCGSGELLERLKGEVPNFEGHGLTIHIGEARSGRKKGFPVLPLDMRDVGMYYDKDYFDAVLIWQAVQFIPEDEQPLLLAQIEHILRSGGYLIIMDYYDDGVSKLRVDTREHFSPERKVKWPNGNLTILRKH